MAQPNAIQQANPVLSTKEISDIYIKKNFDNLISYFATQNHLLNFRFFDLSFTKAETNRLVSHGFSYIPQDIITTKITGPGTVVFNYGKFDTTNINITVTGVCRVRFFVGTYWNYITTSVDAPTLYTAQAALPSSAALTPGASSITNPMTALYDMIYGASGGVPTRLPGPTAAGQVLTGSLTVPPYWAAPATQTAAASPRNFLYNGAFDIWQRTTSATAANGALAFGPDRWWCSNTLGTNGVLTISRTTGVTTGSLYGCSLKISTAPTALQANACELYYTIENQDSFAYLYNQTASFGVLVKGLGNVTQIGLQFCYATTETKVNNLLGSEQVFNVSSSSFTLGSLLAQALGTSMTTSGVVGVRVRIKTVSTGNLWDINNGFVVEQAIVNTGSTVSSFIRAGVTIPGEMAICQRFYYKSYFYTLFAGDASANYGGAVTYSPAATILHLSVPYPTRLRAASTPVIYSPATGTSGQMRDRSTNVDIAGTVTDVGDTGFRITIASLSINRIYSSHFVVDAEF